MKSPEHILLDRIDLFFQQTRSPVRAYLFLKNTFIQLDRVLEDPYQVRQQYIALGTAQRESPALSLGGSQQAFTAQDLEDLPQKGARDPESRHHFRDRDRIPTPTGDIAKCPHGIIGVPRNELHGLMILF